MMRRPRKVPAYRLHKATGQAVVRLDGRDHYLGKHATEASHQKYRRLIAEWLSAPASPTAAAAPATPGVALTIDELMLAFWAHAERHYRDAQGRTSRELDNLRDAIRPLRRLFGDTPARAFGPLALRTLRDAMIGTGLARTTINARINRVRRVFRWAASHELIPAEVVQGLETVAGLQRCRTEAAEPEPVAPVAVEHVEAVLPRLGRVVAALVRLQLLTGCRTEEILTIRGCDLTAGSPNWEYRPDSHKNAWRGQGRVIVLGPQAQAIVRPFLRPDEPEAYLFSPRDAVAELHRGRGRTTRPTPSERRRRSPAPGQRHGACYSRRSYRQAIVRACRRAGVPAWTPRQLRHTAATRIRDRFGVEAAQVVLGHAQLDTTELYAAKSLARAHEVMQALG
jgi:integrase